MPEKEEEMPEEEQMPKEEEAIDETGRKYCTVKEKAEDQSAKTRFWVGADGARFYDAEPITEEEKLEAIALWHAIAQPGTSKGKKKK